MRDRLRSSLLEFAGPIRGLRVLLVGFSGDGFPNGDGANEAVAELPGVGVECTRTHAADPELPDKVAAAYDIAIVSNTRVGEVMNLDERVWSCSPKPVYWFWDLRPGSVGAPLRGRAQHVFLSYRGRWTAPNGIEYHPDQWRHALGCPVGYCPQGAPLREPRLAVGVPRAVFVGDVKNATYHRGRAQICQAVGATIRNHVKRDQRLAIEAELPTLYRSARYCLSMSPRAPGYTSVRTYSILACGGLMALHRFPDCERLFRDGEHAIIFDGASELKERMVALDDDETERRRIADAGRRLHAERHTVAHRVLSICRQVTGVDEDFCGWL